MLQMLGDLLRGILHANQVIVCLHWAVHKSRHLNVYFELISSRIFGDVKNMAAVRTERQKDF
jgi:hypothetical protein